jgi:ketosteroid isomerase-like protein
MQDQDVIARLDRMEQRLRTLEDAEAIRNLKAQYAALCDDHYNADGIAALFSEDAIWESPGLGRFEGREQIHQFFRGAGSIFSFAIHYSLNGHIVVDGDTAQAAGTCSCRAPSLLEIARCGGPASTTNDTNA